MTPDSLRTVGFVGTGVMGAAMAGHLMDAGYELRVHNRSKAKASVLMDRGAIWCDTVADVASGADAVITMVGFPADVEACYLGEQGLIASAAEHTLLIDMTTSSPGLARRIAAAAAGRGLCAIDAPVSGGDVGAKNATLTIMAGGDTHAFEQARELFGVMGRSIALHGGPGAGQHCKMANQIAIAASMLGLAECLAYASGAGLDPAQVIETLSGGSAQTWSLSNYGPRVLRGDFAPGFYIKHFVKDLRIAISEAEGMGAVLPGLDLAKRMYELLQHSGGGELGTQAIWLLYADAEQRRAAGLDADAAASRLAEQSRP